MSSSIRSMTLESDSIANSIIEEVETKTPEKSNQIISGLKKEWIHFKLRFSLIRIIVNLYSNPKNWILAFKYLIQLRKKFLGSFKLKKLVEVDNKYYMGLYTPGWNDLNYKRFIVSELNHFIPVKQKTIRFNHVHLAITNKCALQCDHCYAWDVLNKRGTLNEEDLLTIADKLQGMGTCQIHLTGGEPMIKYKTLINLLNYTNETTNFWINTSGFQLTNERAKELKVSGLTGVFISLDHFEEEAHNSFRKYKDAYYWATTGAKNAVKNNLAVALSVCVTNDFISRVNLLAYMNLAKELGVHFVQFLEPKAVGHFKGKEVTITKENIALLEVFYEQMNFSNDFLDYPIINYHGYYQRRVGCYAGGNRSMYVDTDGNINACTFCHTSSGNILKGDFEEALKRMSKNGCPSY
ncbi:radical SAM protein [Seonamhaeicola sp. MEBiC1930]|uniref:radical SAM/SPASM domain-containing protein n=1 Tax=Seonamhaeicola sp. MEBiC01930 TaxID=2976768 RepID=UPI00325271D0